MGWREFLYLAVPAAMFALLVAVVIYVCSRKRRDRLESPKHRMLDED